MSSIHWGAYGPNLGYIVEQYERYLEDPGSVSSDLREAFNKWDSPIDQEEKLEEPLKNASVEKGIAIDRLFQNIRTYGHLAARINPLIPPQDSPLLQLQYYGLTEEDLKPISAKMWQDVSNEAQTAKEVYDILRSCYMDTLAFEFQQVHNQAERDWLQKQVETKDSRDPLTSDEKLKLLYRLSEVEEFEKFLHRTFVGQKRFSIEGVDMLVPMLDRLVHLSLHHRVENVIMGMAHRGRLNVLAHVLGKPYEAIFSEFHHSPNKDLIPSEGSHGLNDGWTGDVKYHLGAKKEIDESDTLHTRVTLANNPSHLQFIHPVIGGSTRAAQETRVSSGFPVQDTSKALAVFIHGDAAFPGEGVTAETLNLGSLTGYTTGGSIHIIVNNQLGFTTEPSDSRSTRYASDLAKGFEIPIVHVNADDPEACMAAIELAFRYRKRFQKDFMIDLIGYRRFGHNEMDDPFVTQPTMYHIVKQHPTVMSQYKEKLKNNFQVSPDQLEMDLKEVRDRLQMAYQHTKKQLQGDLTEPVPYRQGLSQLPTLQTGVPAPVLTQLGEKLHTFPSDFSLYPKLQKTAARRLEALAQGEQVDWAFAESLAFASILQDGVPIRVTGQDSERGTFAHRNVVLHDAKTGESYCPLQHLVGVNASFAIHNSPLSEASVIGFEYGYNVFAPETLVIWEAQYGDFANAGQVMFDQFLSSSRAKWGETAGLVILLPHGYEGQGPEHSSARLERFLQLAAENNCLVTYPTTAAQYFHLLRRQAAILGTEEARPLIVMAPKSLLRHPRTSSYMAELEQGHYRSVYEEQGIKGSNEKVELLIVSSGKIGVELLNQWGQSKEIDDCSLRMIRLEELYPFPANSILQILEECTCLKEIVWVQEEPKNMGAWNYIQAQWRDLLGDRYPLQYVGRPERSSPATGQPDYHDHEQQQIVCEALRLGREVCK